MYFLNLIKILNFFLFLVPLHRKHTLYFFNDKMSLIDALQCYETEWWFQPSFSRSDAVSALEPHRKGSFLVRLGSKSASRFRRRLHYVALSVNN